MRRCSTSGFYQFINFFKDLCPGPEECLPPLSEQRQLTLIAGMMILALLGVQALQNINEGIVCCGQDDKNNTQHDAIGLTRLR
jgi:hypothetical protein